MVPTSDLSFGIVLSFWLFLVIARQAFDLIGKLWIPVAANLSQMLSIITGIFACCQRRFCLLNVFSVACILSVGYNVFLLLLYNAFWNDMQTFLSGGLQYSHSFFLRYTPLCSSYFNFTTSRWVQSRCLLRYDQLESFQCIVHIIFACVSMIFSSKILCESRINQRRRTAMRKCPKITVQFSSDSKAVKSENMQSYMNSSYDGFADRGAMATSFFAKYHPGKEQSMGKRSMLMISRSNDDQIIEEEDRERYGWPGMMHSDSNRDDHDDGSMDRFKSNSNDLASNQKLSFNEYRTTAAAISNRLGVSRSSICNMTSLISFDPKSSTLIRVQEHVEDESDDELNVETCSCTSAVNAACDQAQHYKHREKRTQASAHNNIYFHHNGCISYGQIRCANPVPAKPDHIYTNSQIDQNVHRSFSSCTANYPPSMHNSQTYLQQMIKPNYESDRGRKSKLSENDDQEQAAINMKRNHVIDDDGGCQALTILNSKS